jgi:peroxiredoxin
MAIAVGTTVPSVTVFADGLEQVNLNEWATGKPTVFAFFPAAFTGVCETEFCTFSENWLSQLNDSGAQIVGISVDTPFAIKEFFAKNNINVNFLSDYNREAIEAFDIVFPDLKGLKNTASRSVFVADATGTIQWTWVSENPGQEPNYEEVAQAVQNLNVNA